MNETIKNIAYVEGFLTALAAVLQDREWVDGKVGNITATTAEVKKLLRDVATLTGCDESELNKLLTAQVEEMRQAVSERTEHIIKWINDDVIPTDNPGEYFSVRKCSNCEKILSAETEYCHGCGARMEVSRDE